ncbi:RDD family protein [Chloroflexus sp.]|uniref:RDD family protein n=1 Tax=Chloroflexus sp. TaxID=1904827 RepID=UPI002ACF0023|nr:RDD family protein [Chloroflexus sp.]
MLTADRIANMYRVETPEGVIMTYTTAGLASRSLAAVIDYTILITLLMMAITVVSTSNSIGVGNEDLVWALWAVFAFVLNWGYYVFFELIWNGQTPGKRWLRLRVLREGGRPVDGAAVVVRNLMRAIDFLPFGYGIGLLTIFIDRHNRRLGDLTAGTVVVRESNRITLDQILSPVRVQVPPRATDAPPTPLLPNLERLSPADMALVFDFLLCRDTLSEDARLALAGQLAALMRQRLELPPADGHPERFLEHVVREYDVFQAMMARQAG